jgi:GntR family transcriptional regulator
MVDRASWRPLWQQVANALRADILSGVLPPGAPLPTEEALEQRFEVSRTTVRSALEALRAEGHVTSVRGRGSFVRERRRLRRMTTELTEQGARWRGWNALMEREGLTPQFRTTVARRPCPPQVAEQLGLEPGELIVVRERVMGAAGEPPAQLADSYIPLWVAERVPALETPSTGPGGMLERLRDAGFRLSFEETISARAPTPAEVDALRLAPGVPVLIVERLTLDADSNVLDYQLRVIDASRIEQSYRFA